MRLRDIEKKLQVEFPEDVRKEILEAIKFYRKVNWGREADKIKKVHIPDPPKVSVKIGDLIFLGYISKKSGKREVYVHVFKAPFPMLLTDKEGKGLFIGGGDFKVEEEGIIG